MPTIPIKLPKSESVFQGTVARWLKADGDHVKAGDKLFEFETDKTTLEIVAPASGRLKIQVPEGTTINIEDAAGSIDTDAAPAAVSPPKAEAAPPSAAASPAPSPSHSNQNDGAASPAGRRLAAESGVALASVAGSGRGGVVLKEDVQTHLEKAKTAPAPAATPTPTPAPIPESPRFPSSAPSENGGVAAKAKRETRERMSGIRQRIAQRLVEAQQTAAILTTFNEADMSRVMELRSKFKEPFKAKHGVNLGFMSFFIKAAIEALRTFPKVNGRIEGSEIVLNHYYDIGVAVSTERGLMVPVVRDADRKSFAELEKEIVNYAVKARDGKMDVADLQGGTFTLTNGGVFGSLLSTPILNPPQSGILGMHAIKDRPVAVNGQVVIRPMMYLALSYDHRIIDGREAVSFLVRIKDLIEDPERMLLEI